MATENENTNVEYRELDLSKLEDLEVFLESAEDVCADALQYQEIALKEDFRSLKNGEVSGEEFFETIYQKLTELQVIIDEVRYKVIPSEQEIEDSLVSQMQEFYNDMIILRNHIRDKYEGREESSESKEEVYEAEPVRLEVTNKDQVTPDKVDGEVEYGSFDEASTGPEPKEKEQANNPSTQVQWESAEKNEEQTEEVVPELTKSLVEATDKTTEQEDLFAPIEQELKQVAEQIGDIHKRVTSLISPEARTDEVKKDLMEIEVCLNRSNDLREKIKASKGRNEDPAVLQSSFKRYTRVAEELDANARAIELRLLRSSDGRSAQREQAVETLQVEKDSSNREEEREEEINNSSTDVPQQILEEADQVHPEPEQVYPETETENEDEKENSEEEVELLTPEVRRKSMRIVSDTEIDGNIPIQVAEKAERRLEVASNSTNEEIQQETNISHKSPVPETVVVTAENVQEEAEMVADLEKNDPLNKVVPDKVPVITHAKLVHEETSLQRTYLNNQRYVSFINAHYTSLAAFERMLDTTVTQIEAKTVDALERFFGDAHSSPFAYIQDMSVTEVLGLSQEAGVRKELAVNNIKYETFLTWIDLVGEMQAVVGEDPHMDFGELFARWMIESDISTSG